MYRPTTTICQPGGCFMSLRPLIRSFPLVTLAFILVCAGFTGCAGGDMATVTISISHPGFAKTHTPSIFDRMLAFLSFSTRAEAGPWPSELLEYLGPEGGIQVGVQSPDFSMEPMWVDPQTGAVTLSVPAGKNRKFYVIVSYYNFMYENKYNRQLGAVHVTDLAPGETKNIPMILGVLPQTPDIGLSSAYISFHVEIINNSIEDGYIIYRADGVDSTNFRKIAEVPAQAENTPFTDSSVSLYSTYSYMIRGYNQYGEGDAYILMNAYIDEP